MQRGPNRYLFLLLVFGLCVFANSYPAGVHYLRSSRSSLYTNYPRMYLYYEENHFESVWAESDRQLMSEEFFNSLNHTIRGDNVLPYRIQFFPARSNVPLEHHRNFQEPLNNEQLREGFLQVLRENHYPIPEQLPIGVYVHDANDMDARSKLPRMDIRYSDGKEGHFWSDEERKLTSEKFFKALPREINRHSQMPIRFTYHMRGKEAALTHYSNGESQDVGQIYREFRGNRKRYEQFDPEEYKQDMDNTFGLRAKPVRSPPVGVLEYKSSEGPSKHMFPYLNAVYSNGDEKHHVYPWEKPAFTPEYLGDFSRKKSTGGWEMPLHLIHQRGQMRDHEYPDIANMPYVYTVDNTSLHPADYYGRYMEERKKHQEVQDEWERFRERTGHK